MNISMSVILDTTILVNSPIIPLLARYTFKPELTHIINEWMLQENFYESFVIPAFLENNPDITMAQIQEDYAQNPEETRQILNNDPYRLFMWMAQSDHSTIEDIKFIMVENTDPAEKIPNVNYVSIGLLESRVPPAVLQV